MQLSKGCAMRVIYLIALALCNTPLLAGDLPKPELTPGVTDPEVTQANLKESVCKHTHFTWTEAHQPPASYLEEAGRDLIREYGYTDTQLKHYQIDHLIPLSLGGHPTDRKNLWPQPLVAKWSARRKDYFEEMLHGKVCRGEISLSDAQNLFRTNWIEGYLKQLGKPEDHPLMRSRQ